MHSVLRRQVAKPCKIPDTHFSQKFVCLVASAVAKSSVATLGDLSLGNGDDVDGDGVELDSELA